MLVLSTLVFIVALAVVWVGGAFVLSIFIPGASFSGIMDDPWFTAICMIIAAIPGFWLLARYGLSDDEVFLIGMLGMLDSLNDRDRDDKW